MIRHIRGHSTRHAHLKHLVSMNPSIQKLNKKIDWCNFFVPCDLAAIFFCVDFSQSCRKLACQKLLNSIFPHFNFDMTQRIFSAHLLRSVLRPVGEHTKGQLISE